MTNDPKGEAVFAFHRWNNAFNQRDKDGQLDSMHFPHFRIAKKEMDVWETPDDWLVKEDEQPERLEAEGWHHTTTVSIEAVQANEEKVHLIIRQSRRNENDAEYLSFDTLWIFTNEEGRWGAKFRSSFVNFSSPTDN
jgi:hypothetical protein